MRGLRIDWLLLTTDTTYIPTGFGPAETDRLAGTTQLELTVDRVIAYDYDRLYRLAEADYTSGELYEYEYDPVGNRLEQIINSDTTAYLYDAANRLASVDGQAFTFDANGNLLNTGVMTNVFDAANRLVETERDSYLLEPVYNGVGDRVAQTVGATTTYFALDVQGLPEVIYTSEGNSYLHLPGVIMAENNTGDIRYLLSDGLGSIRQAVDETGTVVAYQEYDPYGNPVQPSTFNLQRPYGFTGEWWENEVGLLHLRARWYVPETGTFVSRDPVESEPAYLYVHSNPVNLTDPTGHYPGGGLPRWRGSDIQHQVCEKMPNKTAYAWCIKFTYGLSLATHKGERPFTGWVEGVSGCYQGPVPYVAAGHLEGFSVPILTERIGGEVVYDFGTMERMEFEYLGGAVNEGIVGGIGVSLYAGQVNGFISTRKYEDLNDWGIRYDYSGPFWYISRGASLEPLPFSLGQTIFGSPNLGLTGDAVYISLSHTPDVFLVVEGEIGLLNYGSTTLSPTDEYFNTETGQVNRTKLIVDIIEEHYLGEVAERKILKILRSYGLPDTAELIEKIPNLIIWTLDKINE